MAPSGCCALQLEPTTSERFHIECAYVLPYKDHLAEELERAGVKTHCLSRKRTDSPLAAAPGRAGA